MNANRLINMGMRLLMRKGVEIAARKGKKPEDMTPEERQSAKSAQQTAKKAQQGLRTMRRFMR